VERKQFHGRGKVLHSSTSGSPCVLFGERTSESECGKVSTYFYVVNLHARTTPNASRVNSLWGSKPGNPELDLVYGSQMSPSAVVTVRSAHVDFIASANVAPTVFRILSI
jgi:hypothetical protein